MSFGSSGERIDILMICSELPAIEKEQCSVLQNVTWCSICAQDLIISRVNKRLLAHACAVQNPTARPCPQKTKAGNESLKSFDICTSPSKSILCGPEVLDQNSFTCSQIKTLGIYGVDRVRTSSSSVSQALVSDCQDVYARGSRLNSVKRVKGVASCRAGQRSCEVPGPLNSRKLGRNTE